MPLKNGLEGVFASGVKGNGMTLGVTNGAQNGGISCSNDNLNPRTGNYGLPVGHENTSGTFSAKTIGITTDASKSGMVVDTTVPTGYNLYYFVGETVQNANLIDAGRIEEQVTGKVDTSNTQWATNACSPDYTAGVDVGAYNSSSNQFTAPCAGIIYFFASVSNGGRPQIYINGVLFSDLALSGGQGVPYSLNNGIQIVLGKGDKYYATQSTLGYALGANRFYPLKGAK